MFTEKYDRQEFKWEFDSQSVGWASNGKLILYSVKIELKLDLSHCGVKIGTLFLTCYELGGK